MDSSAAPDRTESLALAERLSTIVTSSWMSQALYVAAELGLADLLAQEPRTSEELAAETDAHGPSLQRLLRALTSIDICGERDDGSFELRPLGRVLQRDTAGSLRAWIIFWGGFQWPIWGHLLDSIRTGQSARKLLVGTEDFEHLERDPAVAAVFNQAMVELTALVAEAVVRAYDFSGLKRIVDVGGGYGQMLAAVLTSTPSVSGVVFDLPHARDGALRYLETLGLLQRCDFVAGSFFESLPVDADAYLLKSIIHDWDDDRSRAILINCHRAMAGRGRLLLIERIMPERFTASADHQVLARSDLNMLIGPGGHERTEAEFRTLLTGAGFRLARILPVVLNFSVLEAIPTEGTARIEAIESPPLI